MKTRFSTLDIGFELKELEKSIVGMRLNRVYDVDHKTYLFKLQKPQGGKATLLLESGVRLHTTRFEWPKNEPPSSFTMKLRKHLTNKRLESVRQLGVDRVVDLRFGSEQAAHHLVLELYDKGNMVLTDHAFTILNILRPRVQGEDKFLARESYPIDNFKKNTGGEEFSSTERVREVIFGRREGATTLKKALLPFFDFGPAFLDHLLLGFELKPNVKIKSPDDVDEQLLSAVCKVFHEAAGFSFEREAAEGFIRQQRQERHAPASVEEKYFYRYLEFHPMRFRQHSDEEQDCMKGFEDFDSAVDDFFSSIESQKIDAKALQKEQQSVKKLDNVKRDHAQRIDQLERDQLHDKRKGELIEVNAGLVDRCLNLVRAALANQIDWKEIRELVREGTENGDALMSRIKGLKLEVNRMSVLLFDPYDDEEDEEEGGTVVELDIDLSAAANARKFYVKKKFAASKVVKTVQSHSVAVHSAEKRAKQAMRDVNVISRIVKQRRVFWFEKFLWFVSSENYLVIAGRDQQQNEMIVKRYLGPNDVYVHAEVQGASSVVVKNPSEGPVPPKTLHEAGQMALCYSVAWDSKVVISAYWVNSGQVSKSAPTGEYLTAGSFMIRGKKNFLPPSQLALGFGFMFKLDEDSIERHRNERRVKAVVEEEEAAAEEEEEEAVLAQVEEEEEEEEQEEEEQLVPPPEEDEDEEEGEKFPDTQLNLDKEKMEPVVFVERKKKEDVLAKEAESAKTKEENRHKRGKRGKNKKMREKYMDQDEEDKELAMRLLHMSTKEDSKKNRKKQERMAEEERKKRNQELAKQRMARNQAARSNVRVKNGEGEEEEEVELESSRPNDDVGMLDSLTGCPVPEDSILFALPVVAPYNTMTGYKYKVKITPGSSKRGKAAKTALNVFINDKSGSQRDKDMLKSVKEQDNARNLPGKVKVSSLAKK